MDIYSLSDQWICSILNMWCIGLSSNVAGKRYIPCMPSRDYDYNMAYNKLLATHETT
jgi:hypothetical protein